MAKKQSWIHAVISRVKSGQKSADLDQARPQDVESIRRWLISNLAAHLEVDQHEISAEKSLMEQGLDSLGTVRFSGEIEEWLNVEIDPTLLYEHPSINALALYVATRLDLPLSEGQKSWTSERRCAALNAPETS